MVAATLYILTLGILNCFGGRGDDVGMKTLSKVAFRFVCPVAATLAYTHYTGMEPYDALVLTAGATVTYGWWFIWGWSFEEMTGIRDDKKYHAWVRKIGLYFYPPDNFKATNRRRGIVMKSIRGLYGYPGFALLAWYLNPLYLLTGLAWGLQGVINWLMGRVFPGRFSVLLAEAADGAVKAAAVVAGLV